LEHTFISGQVCLNFQSNHVQKVFMMKKLFVFLILFLGLFFADYIVYDQGTNARVNSSLITLGNLTIQFYDAASSGTLLWEQNFTDQIVNGSWSVKLNLSTFSSGPYYGETYYKEYQINRVELNYSNGSTTTDRLAWVSTVGQVNKTKINAEFPWTNNSNYTYINSGYPNSLFSQGILNISNNGVVAIGNNSRASGLYAIGLGESANASGDYSLALGLLSFASGTSDIAIGVQSNAELGNSIAIGSTLNASSSSIAIGGSTNSSDFSIALGNEINCVGTRSIAIGQGGVITASQAIAIGEGANASRDTAIAIGRTASSSGTLAIGPDAYAGDFFAISIGDSTNSTGEGSIAIGLFSNALGDVGRAQIAIGRSSFSNGSASVALGENAIATGDYSAAIGWNSNVSNILAFATPAASASGYGAVAIGRASESNQQDSIAMGWFAFADNTSAVAIGQDANASGMYSYALGTSAKALGLYSLAMGAGTPTADLNYMAALNFVHFKFISPMGGAVNFTINRLPASSGGEDTVVIDPTTYQLRQSASSIRYKTNVTDLQTDWKNILRLRPVSFNWKTSGKYDAGLIAEEVAEVEPTLVVYGNNGPESVRYDKLSVYLLQVVQEQQNEIDQLKEIVCLDHPEAEICNS